MSCLCLRCRSSNRLPLPEMMKDSSCEGELSACRTSTTWSSAASMQVRLYLPFCIGQTAADLRSLSGACGSPKLGMLRVASGRRCSWPIASGPVLFARVHSSMTRNKRSICEPRRCVTLDMREHSPLSSCTQHSSKSTQTFVSCVSTSSVVSPCPLPSHPARA